MKKLGVLKTVRKRIRSLFFLERNPGFTPTELEVTRLLTKKGSLAPKEIIKNLSRTPRAVWKSLRSLKESGYIRKTGATYEIVKTADLEIRDFVWVLSVFGMTYAASTQDAPFFVFALATLFSSLLSKWGKVHTRD